MKFGTFKYLNRILLFSILTVSACDSRETKLQRFLIQGNEMARKQNFEQARKYFHESLKLDSCFADAWNNLGTISFRQKNFAEALEQYTHAIDCNSEFFPAYLNRANTYYELNRVGDGLTDLLFYEKNQPDTFLIHFSRGLLLSKQRDYSGALSAFRKALTMSKGNVEILVNIGAVHYYRHALDSAEFFLQRAREISKEEPNIYNTLALIETERRRFDKALQHINEAISRDRNNSFFLNNRGYIHLLSGNADLAIDDIDKSISEDPYNAWAYRNKGLFYLYRKDWNNAVRLLKRTEELDPSVDSLHVYLARGMYPLNQEEGCKYYSKARTLNQVSELEFKRSCLR